MMTYFLPRMDLNNKKTENKTQLFCKMRRRNAAELSHKLNETETVEAIFDNYNFFICKHNLFI